MCAQRDVTTPPWRPSQEVRKNADLISQPEADLDILPPTVMICAAGIGPLSVAVWSCKAPGLNTFLSGIG
jgi:hypothetical protein